MDVSPQLGVTVFPGDASAVGSDRLAIAISAVCAREGRAFAGREIWLEIPHNTRTGGQSRDMVRFDDGGWAAYFCTDAQVDVRDILETVAARWAIEEHPNTLLGHDVKEIWGAGQQQVRNIWSNIGCWHLNQWMYTLVELCSWDVAKPKLTDRSNRPWDNPDRRPSHADRRPQSPEKCWENNFSRLYPRP